MRAASSREQGSCHLSTGKFQGEPNSIRSFWGACDALGILKCCLKDKAILGELNKVALLLEKNYLLCFNNKFYNTLIIKH